VRKQHDTCTYENCGRPHKARGYCQTHYTQLKRNILPVGPIKTRVSVKPDECVEDDCHDPVKAKGLCKMHYQRTLRHGHTRYMDRKKAPRDCMIGSCDSHVYARDLCHAHYLKQRKWQSFGVDAGRYQEMLAEQNGVCAICSQPEKHSDSQSGKMKDLAVDHDHKTGVVRALLCSACNTALGLFNDDTALLDAAKAYLQQHLATAPQT